VRAVYRRKYAVFALNFAYITARYRPKPFISGAIENKVKKGVLRFCAHSNLQLLSFNDLEYHPLKLASTSKRHRRRFFNLLHPRVWA
jgi:hypothetical protein